LLDKAVRCVAELDEPAELNPVRANIARQVEADGCSFDEAALRVFSNAPGSYGTNVNFMVMDSQWESADALGDLFVTRSRARPYIFRTQSRAMRACARSRRWCGLKRARRL